MPDEIETSEMRERLAQGDCPFCGHEAHWGREDSEADQAWQSFSCPSCDRQGNEMYLRVGFNETVYDADMPVGGEVCYRSPEPPVWIVLRDFEALGGPEVDVFTNEAAAKEHATRCGWEGEEDALGHVIVREESVASAAWMPIEAE